MKKLLLALSLLLVLLCAAVFLLHRHGGTADPTEPILSTTTVPQTEASTPSSTPAPVPDGWQSVNGLRYYYKDGQPLTGWQNVDEMNRYFLPDGALANGWTDVDGNRCYFDKEGGLVTDWLELDGKRYYLGADGILVTGWLEMDGVRYYFREDGTMARGCVQIDGVNNYFTSTGAYIVMANPWNFVPEGYDPDLVELDKFANYSDMYISRGCYDDLVAMLTACKSECSKAVVVSSYRTHEFQTQNYQRKVKQFLDRGYDQEEAERLAAKVVAVPGTSEHQLGLAVDIVDVNYPYLTEEQADMPAQQWLMEHCWEYGFIMRYPADKTEATGIIYEPWHYRYVGKELARELTELGLTLEEYLDALTQADA